MNVKRDKILSGPGSIGWNSINLLSQEDINVDFISEFEAIKSSAFGPIRHQFKDGRVEVSLSPLNFTSLATLYPYATKMFMDRIYGTTDLPLVVTPRNGAPVTVVNAQITKLPGIKYAAKGSMLKAMMFTGLLAYNTDPATLANWYTVGSVGSNATLAGYDLTKIFNSRYSLVWNGLTILADDAGFDVEFDLKLDHIKGDVTPTIDMAFVELVCRIKFTPITVTNATPTTGEAQYIGSLPFGTQIGADPTYSSAVISGDTSGDQTFTLANAYVSKGQLRYGKNLRQGPVTIEQTRTVTSNLLVAPYTFGTV